MNSHDPYPATAPARDRWIRQRRGARETVDPFRPAGAFIEPERTETGEIAPVGTILLTNRECPWRCLMCDLWRHTLIDPTPRGAIPAQLQHVLQGWARTSPLPPTVKLYNSGSFFDPQAIPTDDHPAIARLLDGFHRVIVECHPALIGERVWRFRDRLRGRLEVAMGLETIHPEALPRLNKRMTQEQFAEAARALRTNGVDLRVFVLFQPPFVDPAEAGAWARRSMRFAYGCGATVVTLIPTRLGNGALEALRISGQFTPPSLPAFEAAVAEALPEAPGRLFADLWDLERFSQCPDCLPARRERLHRMNLDQILGPLPPCPTCSAHAQLS